MDRTHRTSPARLATFLAPALLCALTLTACGGEADEPSSGGSPSESASPSPSQSDTAVATPSTKAEPEPAGPSAKVTIQGNSVEPLAQSLKAGVGETVTLTITSDRSGELHVHATPEQYKEFTVGRTKVEMTFDKPGAVDVEEHESGALVLRVLVR